MNFPLSNGGNGPWEGNVWAVNPRCELGPVCDDLWDNKAAQVVCRQLGYDISAPVIGKFNMSIVFWPDLPDQYILLCFV